MSRSDVHITGTMLANLVRCDQRVCNDIHADRAAADELSGFVQMLWEEGCRHEEKILSGLEGDLVDLREVPMAERFAATGAAMASAATWIAGARLELGDRIGMPDLLLRDGPVWHAGDIKSGMTRAPNGRDPRKEYAAQVGFYVDLMEEGGWGPGDRGFVIGSDGKADWFDMDQRIARDGPSLRNWVSELIASARGIRDRSQDAAPALGAACGLCHWRTLCRAQLEDADDVTLIPGLGRSVRANLAEVAPTVTSLAALDLASHRLPANRTTIRGIGASRLERFQERARILRSPGAKPYTTTPLGLRRHADERHLDLETDPMDDNFVYLHGVLHRVMGPHGDEERYVAFFAERREEERDAYAAAFRFLTENDEAFVSTYSAFEKTTYRMLARRYPEVASAEQIEALFAREKTVDLYLDCVLPHTVWPTSSYGLKKLARLLGFEWRDVDPSGAASIAWWVEYQRTGDSQLRDRILAYNDDDCQASRVVFDGLIDLPVSSKLPWPPDQRAGTANVSDHVMPMEMK